MELIREKVHSADRAYLLLAATVGGLAALCVAALYVFGVQGDAANGLVGAASLLGTVGALALTTVGLRAGWHAFGGHGGMVLFTGLAFAVDAALSFAVSFTPLGTIGLGSGPDGGLGYVFVATFLAGIGAVILIADGIWSAVQAARHPRRAVTA